MTLFDRIKKVSKIRGFALTEVARRAGIGEKSIYAWKPSKAYPEGITPRRETLEKVAGVLNVSADYLLGNSDDFSPATNVTDSKPADLADDIPFAFKGREISPEQMAVLRQILEMSKGDDK